MIDRSTSCSPLAPSGYPTEVDIATGKTTCFTRVVALGTGAMELGAGCGGLGSSIDMDCAKLLLEMTSTPIRQAQATLSID